MTTATLNTSGIASRAVNFLLGIKPLANFAKNRARQMMIDRGEKIGVPWRKQVEYFQSLNWEESLHNVENPNLVYPEYYLCSFHAYEKGNLSWEAAWEVEVAAKAVHAGMYPEAKSQGDAKLRQSHYDLVTEQITDPPQDILDIGCSVGMSCFALQEIYPDAKITGVDLSPYYLAVADYQGKQQNQPIKWVHAAGESTGLPDASFDLVSLFLICHELPQSATREIFHEAKRLLRSQGHLTIMDMNPKSEVYAKMPPYILTLLKSTEPYLDEYFTLDIEQALMDAGFARPTITINTPRHRTIVAKVQ
ncbi:class I SAM-dependent methyltransferase [Merismopedia glauca]|uniref:SAM-dependent methyltransferase n=1 Tax=Merismopedia glauca CCAP 1448/3 TaxID=1296344 RepID=A0A2T1C744_9CYAN|nr:class I SAM-dependent methyltransferase [Merismopedia glauca]PSB04056.1 SAM-dependent methyltransferase [Merismopedia glauca CCAP 1448/3]